MWRNQLDLDLGYNVKTKDLLDAFRAEIFSPYERAYDDALATVAVERGKVTEHGKNFDATNKIAIDLESLYARHRKRCAESENIAHDEYTVQQLQEEIEKRRGSSIGCVEMTDLKKLLQSLVDEEVILDVISSLQEILSCDHNRDRFFMHGRLRQETTNIAHDVYTVEQLQEEIAKRRGSSIGCVEKTDLKKLLQSLVNEEAISVVISHLEMILSRDGGDCDFDFGREMQALLIFSSAFAEYIREHTPTERERYFEILDQRFSLVLDQFRCCADKHMRMLYEAREKLAIASCHARNLEEEKNTANDFLQAMEIMLSDPEMLNPRFNRVYGKDAEAEGFMPTYFSKPLLYGPSPDLMYKYPCPPDGSDWKRISFKVEGDFDKQYGTWHVGYHGTGHKAIVPILDEGFRAATVTCHKKKVEDQVVYFTPSIRYAQHPRYAKLYQVNGTFCQVLFMCRVNHDAIMYGGPKCGTLDGALARDPPCDPHFTNEELEWLVNHNLPRGQNFVIYGLMTRVLPHHPKDLPENAWIPTGAWPAV